MKRLIVSVRIPLFLLSGCGGEKTPPETELATVMPSAKSLPAFTLSGGLETVFNNERFGDGLFATTAS